MIKNLKFKIKNSEGGITLIEVIVVIVIVTMFSMILIADFPKIMRQFAISKTAYRLAQDIRKTEDLGLSGVQIGDNVAAKGYGVYINASVSDNKKYIIYADKGDSPNQQYDSTSQDCSNITNPQLDCVVELIDIAKQEYDIYIKEINGGVNNWASINFKPPNPDIKLVTSGSETESKIDIVLGSSSDSSLTRTVSVNKSGLVEVK